MLAKYQPAFAELSGAAAHHLWAALRTRLPPVPDDADGAELFLRCEEAGVFQAEVVMAVAGDPSPLATEALERILGHKLRPPAEPTEQGASVEETAPPRTARKRTVRDPRLVLEVAPNPRLPGTAAHAGYACWRVGDTVDQCIERGLPARYVGKDTRLGRVRLGSVPRSGADVQAASEDRLRP